MWVAASCPNGRDVTVNMSMVKQVIDDGNSILLNLSGYRPDAYHVVSDDTEVRKARRWMEQTVELV